MAINKINIENQSISTEAEALQDIISWAKDKPLWQQDALRRLCQKGVLNEADYVELMKICKNQSAAVPIASEYAPIPDAAASHVCLRGIKNVEHVNALATNQIISFEKGNGLTVIYGDNGSGKSGYARILKSACRARLNQELKILPNIYESNAGTPKAKIDFAVNDQNHSVNWVAETACDPNLSAISVFDSSTANIHVDNENEVAYNPYPMELLKQLSDAAKEIQRRLNLEIETLENQTPQSLKIPKYHQGTSVCEIISKLSLKTDITKIQALANLSEKEAKEFEILKSDLANDPELTSRKVKSTKSKLEQITSAIKVLCAAITDQQLKHVQGLHRDFVTKQTAATTAAHNLFQGEKLPQIGSECWRELWEAARKYSENTAYPDKAFPYTKNGAYCVLCHQELSVEAGQRLHGFEHFVQNETKKQENIAKIAFQDAINTLVEKSVSLKTLKELQEILGELGKNTLCNELRKITVQAKWRLRSFLRNINSDISIIPLLQEYPEERIAVVQSDLTNRIATLTAEKTSEVRKQAEKKLLELEDRSGWIS